MAETIVVRPNQSMQDVILMACGTREGAAAFCRVNDVSISYIPSPGETFVVPDGIAKDAKVLAELANSGTVIGTLNLGVCATVVSVELLNHDSYGAVFGFVAGAGSVGVEWGVSLAGGDVPTVWTLVDMGFIIVTGLEASTEYKVWVRSKCLGNYSSPISTEFTTDEAPPLGFAVVLKPRMRIEPAEESDPHSVGYYYFDLVEDVGFESVYDLDESYLSSNTLHYETEEQWNIGGTINYHDPMTASTQPAKSLTYNLPIFDGLGYMMVWGRQDVPIKTVTFSSGVNQAYVSPLFILDNVSQNVIEMLIGDIEVDLVSATADEVVLRLTRTHPPVGLMNFANMANVWLDAAAVGVADPTDPLNVNKRIVTLGPGFHIVGSRTTYSGGITPNKPPSAFTMIIEVA